MPLPKVEVDIPGGYQIEALLHGRLLQRAWHRARLDAAAVLLPPGPSASSLDLAAGAGILTWRFPSAGLVSVDLRLEACRAIRAHTPGARALVAELGHLPFQSAAFTHVYFLETLEHLMRDHGQAVLAEIRRVTRPGGRCLVTTPNYRSHWVAIEWLMDRLKVTPPFEDGQHVTRYTPRTLRRAVEDAGWRVERTGSFNVWAPLAGVCSRAAGARSVAIETRWAGHLGALLYAICEPGR